MLHVELVRVVALCFIHLFISVDEGAMPHERLPSGELLIAEPKINTSRLDKLATDDVLACSPISPRVHIFKGAAYTNI